MAPQDSFFDDEEDTCPLCIEEFDLSDRNFRPCPCGYQICQFCFNNLKTNMNGLCPACRRPYDEKTIEWKVVTPEEEAEFRASIAKNQKKRATEQRQKEVQKREAEKDNRKNLVGVRVVQKNLVYVTGLVPTVREDELLKTLRRPEFFGQYGNIQKISISNRKSSEGYAPSLGIYVTFEKKEEAARCIQAVNGSQNGDRVLRAQLGTTKYCSAWLRHEQCGNRQCMFLHELGDEEDSYSRQDLSSLNSVGTQRPVEKAGSSSRSASRQHAPISHAVSSQPMARTSSKEGSDAGEGPALPASANWARNTQQRSRRGSHATSLAASSPAVSASVPATMMSTQGSADGASPAAEQTVSNRKSDKSSEPSAPVGRTRSKPKPEELLWSAVLQVLANCPETIFGACAESGDAFPPLFDLHGADRRRALRDEEENRLGEQEQQPDAPEPSDGEPESGSLALGGEPDVRDQTREALNFDQRRAAAPAPIQRTNADGMFSPTVGYGQGSASVASVGGRAMTPQQFPSQGSFVDQMPPGLPAQRSGLFQGQGHSRGQSRYSFANESTSGASNNVKVATDPRIMAQQSNMMPSTYRSQPGNQFYASSMPGPPPGLKSTGTPPVGGMFGAVGGSGGGQGHSFGGSAAFGGGASVQDKNELLQSLIRGRGTGGSSSAHDAGKREYFSNFQNQFPPSSSSSSTPAPAAGGLLATLYGAQPGAFQDLGPKQKKKGKKHRHANTSSSGGSGLVNLADPGILRMQHQQETASGVGQGLFGGQSQDDDLLPLDEASISVDALVADDEVSTPDRPLSTLLPSQIFNSPPSWPPGLGLGPAHAHPSTGLQRGSTPVLSAPPGLSTPRAMSPAVPRPVTPLAVQNITPTKDGRAVGAIDVKKNLKDITTKNSNSKDAISQASNQSPSKKGKQVLQDEDFPALDSVKTESPSSKLTPAVPSKLTQSSSPGKSSQERKPSKSSTDSKMAGAAKPASEKDHCPKVYHP